MCLDTWVSYDVAYGQPCPGDEPGAEQLYLFIQTPLAIADHFPSKTFSFKHHLTGEAWPVQSKSTFSFKHHLTGELEAWPAWLFSLRLAHYTLVRLNTWVSYDVAYGQPLPWQSATPLDRQTMASLQSNSTFSFKHHSANGIRCSSNIAIADHFPSKTFSFKHHLQLTGEAWPACKAILPFHSNTT